MITRDGWLIVGSKSKDAELLTSFLRKTLGSLPIRLAVTNNNPSDIMTNWVSGETEPRNFDIESQCELREIGGDEVIKCKNLAMPNDEVTAHIESGMQVVNLALSWNDRVSFILNEDLTISSLKYTDLLQYQLDDQMIEDNTLYLEARLILMNECYSQMLNALLNEFGGEYVEPNGEK